MLMTSLQFATTVSAETSPGATKQQPTAPTLRSAKNTFAPFTTDGCSMFPNRSIVNEKDWCDCCLAHDLAYWRGGSEAERLKADQALRTCVATKTKNDALAETMYLGVRSGGGPQVKTPFRWGYGWPYGRGYKALSESESASVKTLEDVYRMNNPTLTCEGDPLLSKNKKKEEKHVSSPSGKQ
jgi:hypothetical protein